MIEPVRILHVFAQMNRGGAETMIMNLYRQIDWSQFSLILLFTLHLGVILMKKLRL
jgi:hypothetical protein